AMVELWQADASGAYRPDFGWGRCGTDPEGRYEFTTVEPGSVDGQAPHLELLVFARGLLKPLLTRMYFPDERANAEDPVLSALPEEDRLALVARAEGAALQFDLRLQGEGQTPFFALCASLRRSPFRPSCEMRSRSAPGSRRCSRPSARSR